MDDASISSQKTVDFQNAVVDLLIAINRQLGDIHNTLKFSPDNLDDHDVCDLAVHLLFQVGPNVSEIARKLSRQGIKVDRHSLTKTKKFARFQDKLEVFRNGGEVNSGHLDDDGRLEAYD